MATILEKRKKPPTFRSGVQQKCVVRDKVGGSIIGSGFWRSFFMVDGLPPFAVADDLVDLKGNRLPEGAYHLEIVAGEEPIITPTRIQ